MARNPVHLLYPNKVCHKPEDVARLLRAEFACIRVDTEKADTYIQGLIDALTHPKFKDAHRKLLGKSLHITVSDRDDFEDDYISFVAMPGVAPGVFYSSEAHRDAAASILERASKVLNYRALPA
jgi:hypothetical protein